MALSAVQATHIRNLQWTIWFCQVDLNGFREGDWINVKEDLYDFLDYRFSRTALMRAIFPNVENPEVEGKLEFTQRVSQTEVADVQQELNSSLRAFAYKTGESEERVLRSLRHLPRERQHSLRYDTRPLQLLPIKDGMLSVIGVSANEPFRQMISFGQNQTLTREADIAMLQHLVSSGILRGQLRICPECERLFLITRKPRTDMTFHCSLRCSRNAATKKYRERLAREGGTEARTKERKRSHERYVAKQREKHPKAKVRRNPRVR